jgi:hypothetical protein
MRQNNCPGWVESGAGLGFCGFGVQAAIMVPMLTERAIVAIVIRVTGVVLAD